MLAPSSPLSPLSPLAVPLHDLLDRLDNALGAQTASGAWLLKVEGSGTDVTIGLLGLDDRAEHPVDALLGVCAEPSWTAAGVIVHGRARDLDPCPGRPGSAPSSRPVRALYVVGTDGTDASRLRYLDRSAPIFDPGSPEGRISDCCRRIMGLCTPPPPAPPLHWLASVWLAALLGAVVEDCSPPASTWADAAAFHPLVRRSRGETPQAMAARVARRAGTFTWSALRTATGPGPERSILSTLPAEVLPSLAPGVAEWMDDGMFARWLLGELPDPVDVLIDLAGLVSPVVMRPLLEVVEAWELW